MSPGPPEDIGPDPHLNQRGVPLTREQRRILGVTGLLIGLGLALALAGLRYGFPPGWAGGGDTPPTAPYRVVLSGPGRALVSVQQDGGVPQRLDVALPWEVPIDLGASFVTVEAQAVGPDRGAITCAVQRTSDRSVQETRSADTAGAVRCGAVLR